jgi:hypothetical protein
LTRPVFERRRYVAADPGEEFEDFPVAGAFARRAELADDDSA